MSKHRRIRRIIFAYTMCLLTAPVPLAAETPVQKMNLFTEQTEDW